MTQISKQKIQKKLLNIKKNKLHFNIPEMNKWTPEYKILLTISQRVGRKEEGKREI